MASVFTSELKEGMITSADVYSGSGHMIMPKSTVVTKAIIQRLAENQVVFVEIEEESMSEGASASIDDPLAGVLEFDNSALVETPEYKKFVRRYDNEIDDIKVHFNDVIKKNAPIEVDAMLKSTLNIVKAADSSLSIFNMLNTLKAYDDSTFNHSLNVSLICNILGGWLGLPDDEVELLTSAGLFHDIGKLLIPDSIIKKPGKLTDEEFAIIKSHPRKGYDLLKKQKVDIHIQYAALMHHEKCDGTGYPIGLIDNQIDWCAQIVTIADIYEAMTAKRVYRDPLSPFTVISNFEQDGLRKYNPKFLLTFLENVVNSYMNCKVKLSNGEEGDIIFINKVNLSKPMIKTTHDEFIDLSKDTSISIDQVY